MVHTAILYLFETGMTLEHFLSECEKDRILFFNREINNLKQLSYEVDENLLISDHRPVFGDFNLNVSFFSCLLPKTCGRIPTVKLKIPGKAFLKSESRTSVTFKL